MEMEVLSKLRRRVDDAHRAGQMTTLLYEILTSIMAIMRALDAQHYAHSTRHDIERNTPTLDEGWGYTPTMLRKYLIDHPGYTLSLREERGMWAIKDEQGTDVVWAPSWSQLIMQIRDRQ